jgi:hypothetical protein
MAHCSMAEFVVLRAVALGEIVPTYRGARGRFAASGRGPQAPEKNRFFGDFCV